jgi:hypothetical protein
LNLEELSSGFLFFISFDVYSFHVNLSPLGIPTGSIVNIDEKTDEKRGRNDEKKWGAKVR